LAADDDGAGGLGGQPHEGHVLRGAVPAFGGPTGQETGAGGVGAHDPSGGLPRAQAADDLSGAGRELPGSNGEGSVDPGPGASPGADGSSGDAGARRRGSVAATTNGK